MVEITDDLVQIVRNACRIRSTILDEEIRSILEAAVQDMVLSGVEIDIENSLVVRALVIYAKANIGMDNKDSVRYLEAYDKICTKLALTHVKG